MKTWIVLLWFAQMCFSQIHGVVRDAQTGTAISYVNIYIDDKRWVSALEDGSFSLMAAPDEAVTFSAIGYETMKVNASEANDVRMKPATYALQAVTVAMPLATVENIVGGYQKKDLDLFYTTKGIPSMLARYFGPQRDWQQTPHLKKLVIGTKSTVRHAKFNVHILAVNPDGTPGSELAEGNIIGIAKKGIHDTEIDLTPYHLTAPDTGFFVAVEWLIIPENKDIICHYKDSNGVQQEDVEYMPLFATVRTQENSSWGFDRQVSWRPFQKVSPERIQKYYDEFKKATGKDAPPYDDRHVEFAMKITLTN